jgi:hypothetical protein
MVSFDDIERLAKFECEKCHSVRIMLFECRNIADVVAYACAGCNNFQVFAKDKRKLLNTLNAMEQNNGV